MEMNMWKKISIGAGIGGVLLSGFLFLPKLIKLKNTAPELDVIPHAKLHKIDFSGITIRIDVQLKNPTLTVFKMKYPYIRLSYKGSAIGTSQAINQDIEMTGLGEANISEIMMTIPMMSLLSVSGKLLQALQNNQAIQLDITTITHIDPYWTYKESTKAWRRLPNLGKKTSIPYSHTQTVTLKKEQEQLS